MIFYERMVCSESVNIFRCTIDLGLIWVFRNPTIEIQHSKLIHILFTSYGSSLKRLSKTNESLSEEIKKTFFAAHLC